MHNPLRLYLVTLLLVDLFQYICRHTACQLTSPHGKHTTESSLKPTKILIIHCSISYKVRKGPIQSKGQTSTAPLSGADVLIYNCTSDY